MRKIRFNIILCNKDK